jgi:hypothetical protein
MGSVGPLALAIDSSSWDVRAGVGGPSVDSLLVELPGAHAAVIVRAWRRAARIVGLLRALQIFRWLRALQIV